MAALAAGVVLATGGLTIAATASEVPADALERLWAVCVRNEEPECLSPSPAPSSSATATVSPTASPSSTGSAVPTPTATPSPTTTPSPTPTGNFIGPDPTGPTSGSAWTALRAAADASPGTPDITCNQNQRTHPGTALAAALVYAASGEAKYRTKAIALIEAAYPTARTCGNSILSLGRQLGAYVLAADYVGYRAPAFVAWLSDIRTRELGGHSRWHTLRGTVVDTSNNWGTFALASLTVADAYLADRPGLDRDWLVFAGYGDGTWPFRHTASYQAIWSCPEGFEINPASCTDPRKEGAAVEDASRTSFPTLGGYPAEAAQGYVLTAEILSRAGYDAWTVNDRQVCRNALWRERLGNLNYSSADRYVTWMTNERCGLSQPTQAAGYGRVFGFTDWLFPAGGS
jgi:hypothetical protein